MNEIALGNVLGSNMANLGLSVGLSILLATIVIIPQLYRRELVILAFATAALTYFASDGIVSVIEGVLLLVGFGVYLLVITRAFKDFSSLIAPPELDYFVQYLSKIDVHLLHQYRKIKTKRFRAIVNDFLAVAGCAGVLIIGSRLLLFSILDMAKLLGVTSGAVAATIVAIGTTTPELSVSIASVRKGYHDMLFGNILGSNVVNILLILGLGAVLSPIAVPAHVLHFAIPLLCLSTALLLAVLAFPWKVSRVVGVGFLAIYGVFLWTAWV